LKTLYRENGSMKTQEYAIDWVERKGFDWNVHANLPEGTPFWYLSDDACLALEGIPADQYAQVLVLGEPDGVSMGQTAYEKLHPETAEQEPPKSEYEKDMEDFNASTDQA